MRVLVVDDNRDAADSLAMLLELWGHEVQVVNEPATALEVARTQQPEIVLLDIGLPGMDGYEVAKLLREQGLRKAFLAAVTGYGQEEDRQRAQEAGFDYHLVKPLDPDLLQELLNRAQDSVRSDVTDN